MCPQGMCALRVCVSCVCAMRWWWWGEGRFCFGCWFMGLCLFEGALLHLFSCCRVGGWRSCACVSLRGIHPFIPACAVGSGWLAHAREGEGGGDAPCIPVRGHLITQRYAIAHTCTGCTAPALLFAVHIAPLSLAAHMLSQQHSDIPNARSLAQSAMHAWQAALSRLQTACRALSTVTPPPPPCTSSTPRMWGALTHVHHISCMHL